jgi:DNA-binding transcriptional LysR family regulator
MRRSEIPSLDDLRAFEATARLGSVRLAADNLALTHGAVSRRITKLSQDLGFSLFEKSGRGLRLTQAGETLNLTLGRFFAELAETVEKLRRTNTQQDAVVLSCEPSVAMRWLIPRLAQFQAAFPHFALHLSVGGGRSTSVGTASTSRYGGSISQYPTRGMSSVSSPRRWGRS